MSTAPVYAYRDKTACLPAQHRLERLVSSNIADLVVSIACRRAFSFLACVFQLWPHAAPPLLVVDPYDLDLPFREA